MKTMYKIGENVKLVDKPEIPYGKIRDVYEINRYYRVGDREPEIRYKITAFWRDSSGKRLQRTGIYKDYQIRKMMNRNGANEGIERNG